jgi:hypothetical protein
MLYRVSKQFKHGSSANSERCPAALCSFDKEKIEKKKNMYRKRTRIIPSSVSKGCRSIMSIYRQTISETWPRKCNEKKGHVVVIKLKKSCKMYHLRRDMSRSLLGEEKHCGSCADVKKDKEACLDGKDVVSLVLLASHQKAELSHTFGTATRNGLGLGDFATTSAVAVLLVEFLLASLTLTLQALDDIDGATNVSIVIVCHLVAGVLSLVAHGTATGQRLGVSKTRTACKVEVDLAAARRSERGSNRLAHGSGGLCSARGLTTEEWLGWASTSLGRRRVKTLRRWWTESLGGGVLALASATRTITVLVQVFHRSEELIGVTFVVNGVEDLSIVLLFGLRSWEAGINVLRDDTELLISSSCEAREISFFEGTVFIQGTTHKIGAVGKIGGLLGVSDTLGTTAGSLAVDSSNWWIRLHLVERRSTHQSGTGPNVNNRLGTRCPKTHVIVLVVIIRVSESSLFVGVVTIRIIVLIVFVLIVILVEVNVELILIFLVVVIIIDIGVIVIVKLFFFLGLLLCLSSQTSDVVLLNQGVVDGQFDCDGGAVTSDPIILTGDTTGKLVELGAIRSEVRGVGTEKLGAWHGMSAGSDLPRCGRGDASLGGRWGLCLGSGILAVRVDSNGARRCVLRWGRSSWACELDTGLARSFLGRRGLLHRLRSRWLHWCCRLAATSKLNGSLLGLFSLSLLQLDSGTEERDVSRHGGALVVQAKHGHVCKRWAGSAWARRTGEPSVTSELGGRGKADVADEGAASLLSVGSVLGNVQVVIRVSIDGLGQQGGLLLDGRSNGGSLEIVWSELLLLEVYLGWFVCLLDFFWAVGHPGCV